MNREQMIAWLTLEGWEYAGTGGCRLEHIIQHKRNVKGTWYGACVVIQGRIVKCHLDETAVSPEDCHYGGFDDATTESIARLYNALQEKDHAS